MKKKRPYVLTPAGRAACLRNLEKARAAPWRFTAARRAAVRRAQEAARRKFRMTPARLAANGANIRKAQAASVTRFRFTAARRASLRKAAATPRSPEKLRHPGTNLKHGLFMEWLEESLGRLGEDPRELAALRQRVERAFFPNDDAERRILRRLTHALWRRLRLYRAQARWETDKLNSVLDFYSTDRRLDPDEVRLRGYQFLLALSQPRKLFFQLGRLLSRVEHLLRGFLRTRTGADPNFRVFTRKDKLHLAKIERLEEEIHEDSMLLHAAERLESNDYEIVSLVERFKQSTT